MLSLDDAVHYLLARALVSPDSILDGELTILSVARRHHNLRVERRDGPGYLVKQPADGDLGARATLWHEAAFYDLCQREPALAPIRALLPRLLHLDPEIPLLALELLEEPVHLWQRYQSSRTEAFPTAVARALGRALGTVHKVFRPLRDDDRLRFLGEKVPWVLRVHKPGPELLSTLSAANLKTLEILQTEEALSRNLDRLGACWQPETLIHGDVKSDNVLVLDRAGTGDGGDRVGEVEIRLVDWELAQLGDPAWDLAGALQDFILFWIFSMPVGAVTELEELVARARHPLAALQPAVRALWRGYREGAELDHEPRETAGALLGRAVRFSAARLIQSAYELAHDAASLPAPSVLLLQVGANLLNDPAGAQVELYGLVQELPG